MPGSVSFSDNAGYTVPPGALGYTPKAASGITITDASITSGDHTQALTAGKTYLIMATTTGGFVMGIATAATAANIIWLVPAGGVLCFHMPLGYATLHFVGLVNDATGYIVELE